MPLTRYFISEQVQRLLAGDDPSAGAPIHLREIQAAIAQVCNSLLKMEYLKVDGKFGQSIPNGASVATYDNITVSVYKNVSKALLPATPLRLPRDLGVFQIFDPANVNTLYIPIEMGQAGLLPSQPILSNLLGHIGYERFGNTVFFTKDLTTVMPSPKVTMRLVVLDMTQYTDYDILPVPADMESVIVQEVYKLFSTVPVPDKIVDSAGRDYRKQQIQQQNRDNQP